MKATGPIKDEMILSGTSIYTFQPDEIDEGSLTAQMKADNEKDAYLLVSSFDEPESLSPK